MYDRPLQLLSKDSVTVAVDAVIYYRIENATIAVTKIENVHHSTRLLAQTTLRNVLGTKNLSDILSDREHISHMIQVDFMELHLFFVLGGVGVRYTVDLLGVYLR